VAAETTTSGQLALPSRVPPSVPPETAPARATVAVQSTSRCVANYDLQHLAERQAAFDGTVVDVRGDDIVFHVNRAFWGVQQEEIILPSARRLRGITGHGTPLPLNTGDRLLVAADGAVWACGFTQAYDPAVADQWAQVRPT
jgi:hypothetical protein